MPEGDSVAKLARRLDAVLLGRRLTTGQLRVPAHATASLAGATVLEHATHGKHLLTRLELDSGAGPERLTLHTHLKMDGEWALLGPGKHLPRRMLPDVRVLLRTEEDRTAAGLKLPVVELLRTADEARAVGHLGPDLLHDGFDAAEAVRRLGADPDRPLVAALLDQRAVAGLGNLWANEISYLSGHSPWTPVRDVDLPAVVARAKRALRFSATHPRAYQVTTGDLRPGEQHWVTGRAGRPCKRCGTTVQVVEEVPGDPGRRRTWWCPSCQPGPGPEPGRLRPAARHAPGPRSTGVPRGPDDPPRVRGSAYRR